MTLIYEFDLNIEMYHCVPKPNFLGQRFQKLEPEQDRQTDGRTDGQTEGRDLNVFPRRVRGGQVAIILAWHCICSTHAIVTFALPHTHAYHPRHW